MDKQFLFDLLKLSFIPKVSSTRIRNLIDHFKDPSEIFKSPINELKKVELIDSVIANNILSSNNEKLAEEQILLSEKYQSRIVTYWDEEYPKNLKNISYPPILIFCKGKTDVLRENSIAIIGTRSPTQYGIDCTKHFASALSKEGLVITSGLASGIDTLAHKAALENNTSTIAVLGCGIDIIYPSQNIKLAETILESGAILSEYPLGTKPQPKNFPARNRIISGLSLGILLIESDLSGGGMITAQFAFDQDREVFAIPGNINSKKSRGTNKLIKDSKAKLIQNVDDILIELNLKKKSTQDSPKTNLQLTFSESKLLEVIGNTPKHIDNISDETELNISETLVNLLNLELKGLIKQLPGKMFQVVE